MLKKPFLNVNSDNCVMRIGRTLPPAASPIYIKDIVNGLKGLMHGKSEILRFESEIKKFYGVQHCFFLSSGKAALTIILKALHELHPERDKILIPAFVCYSVPSAIIRSGLTVELCDVNPETLDYNFTELKKLVDSSFLPGTESNINSLTHAGHIQPIDSEQRTDSEGQFPHSNFKGRLLAVIGVHLFGLCSDIKHIKKLVDDPAVAVVEDAAQAMGTKGKRFKPGILGDVSFFSLGRSKALSTVEGGIIITNRREIAEAIAAQLEHIRNYGTLELARLIFGSILLAIFQHPAFFWFPKCFPFLRVGDTVYDSNFKIRKFSSFQAGLARNWLIKLERFQNNRRQIAKRWASIIKSSSIYQFFMQNGHIPDMLRLPIKIADEELWKNILQKSFKNGCGIIFTYPDTVNHIAELEESFRGQTYPSAEKLPHQLITLPIHPYVSQKDMEKISKLLCEIDKL